MTFPQPSAMRVEDIGGGRWRITCRFCPRWMRLSVTSDDIVKVEAQHRLRYHVQARLEREEVR